MALTVTRTKENETKFAEFLSSTSGRSGTIEAFVEENIFISFCFNVKAFSSYFNVSVNSAALVILTKVVSSVK